MLIARHPIWLFVLEFERFKPLAPSRRPFFFCTSLTEKKNRKMLIEYFFSVFLIEIDQKRTSV